MTTCACLSNANLTDIVLKAKKITFDTSILKHTVMQVLRKKESPFICPNASHQCRNCSSEALAQLLHRFENHSKARRKSA